MRKRIGLICQECGAAYTRNAYAAATSHFCSNACRAATSRRKFLRDRKGERYGRWLVLELASNGRSGDTRWLCRCDCGTERVVHSTSLTSARSKSCGCWHREVSAEQAKRLFTKHGMSGTRAYSHFVQNRRRTQDRYWTVEMGRLLLDLQPACVVCGAEEHLAIDHIRPVSKGHPLIPGNACVLCRQCNARKADRELADLPMEMLEPIARAGLAFYEAWRG